jgi:hypothetical protein
MASMCSDGDIEFLTKSSALQKELDEDPRFKKDRKYIEILVAFTSPKEEVVSDVLLPVEATVEMNQGVTRFDVDETSRQFLVEPSVFFSKMWKRIRKKGETVSLLLKGSHKFKQIPIKESKLL